MRVGLAAAASAHPTFYDGDDNDVTLVSALYNPSALPIAVPEGAVGGVAAVPEPAGWLTMTLAGIGAAVFGWRRKASET